MFCPNCGGIVVAGDTRCPECAESLAKKKRPQGHPRIVYFFAFFALLFGVLGFFGLLVSLRTNPGPLAQLRDLAGALGLPVAFGLWRRRPWVRSLGILFFVAYPPLALACQLGRAEDTYLSYTVFADCLIGLAALRYLYSRAAREYFA